MPATTDQGTDPSEAGYQLQLSQCSPDKQTHPLPQRHNRPWKSEDVIEIVLTHS